jgi:hypothetical protein
MTRLLKIIGLSVGAVVLVVILLLIRFWWASSSPRFPDGWPADSVFIKNPYPVWVYPLAPRGSWVGCWFDAARNVDRCKFGDYRGKVRDENSYSTCDGKAPLPDAKLVLRDHDQATIFVFLADGTPLFAADFCNSLKHRPEASTPYPAR